MDNSKTELRVAFVGLVRAIFVMVTTLAAIVGLLLVLSRVFSVDTSRTLVFPDDVLPIAIVCLFVVVPLWYLIEGIIFCLVRRFMTQSDFERFVLRDLGGRGYGPIRRFLLRD